MPLPIKVQRDCNKTSKAVVLWLSLTGGEILLPWISLVKSRACSCQCDECKQEIFEHWQVGTLFSTLVTKDSSIMFIPCDQIKQDTFWFDLCKGLSQAEQGRPLSRAVGCLQWMPRCHDAKANPFAGGHVKSSSCPKPPLCACSKRSESQRWCSQNKWRDVGLNVFYPGHVEEAREIWAAASKSTEPTEKDEPEFKADCFRNFVLPSECPKMAQNHASYSTVQLCNMHGFESGIGMTFDDVRSLNLVGKFERCSMLRTTAGENYLLLDGFLNPFDQFLLPNISHLADVLSVVRSNSKCFLAVFGMRCS